MSESLGVALLLLLCVIICDFFTPDPWLMVGWDDQRCNLAIIDPPSAELHLAVARVSVVSEQANKPVAESCRTVSAGRGIITVLSTAPKKKTERL